jgi:hypothetical protein
MLGSRSKWMNVLKRIIGIADAPYISTLVMATYTLVYFFSTLAFCLKCETTIDDPILKHPH